MMSFVFTVLVTDHVLERMSEEIGHLAGPAKIRKLPVKDDLLIEEKHFVRETARFRSVVRDKYDRNTFFSV